MKIIEIENLSKSYGENRGIENVSFSIEEGEIVGFIGPNGAGKSTTIKILLNMIFKDSGIAKIFNMDCVEKSKEIKEKIGYVPSEVRFYDSMKVKDIIEYSMSFYKNCDKERVRKLCSELEIDLNKKMGELSLGNKKKVAIVQALVHSPDLIILDEPTNGLDPLIQKKLFEIILEENKKGKTIFLSSHNLNEIQNYCSKAIIIKEGKIVDIKEIESLKTIRNKKITIISKDIKEYDIKKLGVESIDKIKDKISFSYSGDLNNLIRVLSKYSISDLSIGEEELLDTFMHYYEGDK
ncbi:ABC transporter ATP-binding protein [Clostridium thermobutyricum]|uniref:ABC transporter ATP-binding protein n=1 Tax=Clostridium thermobutyricum TaxID=29372 RepID=UPI0018AC4111|nr:ABC transporter ATP-binding protein [Clostridium thermobutyricum]